MRNLKLFLSFSFFHLFISSTIFSQDLTGIWQDDNGTRYTVRQINSEVFWWMDGKEQKQNVFYGVLAGNTICGEWADLPGGNTLGDGTLMLQLVSEDLLRKKGESGNYGASEWRRIPVFIQPGQSEWEEIYSFSGPKVPYTKIEKPADLNTNISYDQIDEEALAPKLRLIDIEETKAETSKMCYWPGDLSVIVQNVGNITEGEYPVSIRGERTVIGISEISGRYNILKVPLVHSLEWGSTKFGMEPGEKRKTRLHFSSGDGYTISKIADYWVRIELVKMVWNADLQKNQEIIIDRITKSFSNPGYDLSIPTGSLSIYKETGQRVSLSLAVKNIGELATTGNVVVRVLVPLKEKKSVEDNWVEIVVHSGEPLEPGETFYTNSFEDQAETASPDKGKPDWDNMLVHAWSTCKSGMNGFDKDKRNNYFFGKSRIATLNPKYK